MVHTPFTTPTHTHTQTHTHLQDTTQPGCSPPPPPPPPTLRDSTCFRAEEGERGERGGDEINLWEQVMMKKKKKKKKEKKKKRLVLFIKKKKNLSSFAKTSDPKKKPVSIITRQPPCGSSSSDIESFSYHISWDLGRLCSAAREAHSSAQTRSALTRKIQPLQLRSGALHRALQAMHFSKTVLTPWVIHWLMQNTWKIIIIIKKIRMINTK